MSNPAAPPGAHASWAEVQDLGTERRIGSLHTHLELAREKAGRFIHHKAVGENGRTYVKEKISSGLILVRTPDQTMAAKDSAGGRKEYQALLVKGRLSYAFSEFAHGRYDPKQLSSVRQLIEQMTIEERLVIRSLDFDEIWNMVWARHHVRQINWRKGINSYRRLQIVQNGWGESDGTQNAQYIRRREKFAMAWLSSSSASQKLRDMLAKAKGAGPSRWEFPKGKRSDQNESDLSCALREFSEETQISVEHIRHLPGFASRVSKYVHMNVLYVNTHYLAVLDSPAPDPASLIKLENVDQVSEVVDVQWMGLRDMDRVQGPVGRSLSNLAREAFAYIRNYQKGKVPSRFLRPVTPRRPTAPQPKGRRQFSRERTKGKAVDNPSTPEYYSVRRVVNRKAEVNPVLKQGRENIQMLFRSLEGEVEAVPPPSEEPSLDDAPALKDEGWCLVVRRKKKHHTHCDNGT